MKRLTLRAFEREGAAVAFDHIDDQLGVFPVFVLSLADIERATTDVSEINIAGPDSDFTRQVTVGSAIIATATGLVEHQRAVLLLEEFNQVQCRLGGDNFFNHVDLHVKKGRLPAPWIGSLRAIPISEEAELIFAVADQ